MIRDEFYAIAGRALKAHRGADSLSIVAIDPSRRGPVIRWDAPLLYRDRVRRPIPGGGTVLGPPAGPVVLDLLVRTLALRWAKGSPHVPTGWQKALSGRYRRIFGLAGPATGPGWTWLWEAGAQAIQDHGTPRNFVTTDTKEKYGTIRWYYQAEESCEGVDQIIDAVEHLSGFICEDCGRPGRTRKGGWIRTLCDAHAKGRPPA